MTRAEKAILFMLRNEDYSWDKNCKLEDLKDGAGWTFCGLTQRDDTKYLPSDAPTIVALSELYKTNKSRAIEIIKDVYVRAYWNPKYDRLLNERTAIRLFDLGVNMGVPTSIKLLQQGLIDLGSPLIKKPSGVFDEVTINEANRVSLAGDNLEAAIAKNIDLFVAIFNKMKEIVMDAVNRDMAEMALDMSQLSAICVELNGKMVDDDMLKELVEEAKERYTAIAQKPNFARFLKGWMNRANKDEYSI